MNIKKLLGYVISIVCAFFVIRLLLSIDIELLISILNARSYMTIFILASIIAFLINVSAKVYVLLLNKISKNDNFDSTLMRRYYLLSNIGKYLPGNVMQYAGRNMLGVQLGLNNGDIFVATIIEIILTLTSTVIVVAVFSFSLIGYLLNTLKYNKLLYFVIIILILMTILVYYYKKEIIKGYFIKLLDKQMLVLSVKVVAFYVTNFIIISVTYLLILKYVVMCDITPSFIPLILSSFTLAWIIGFLTPGSPGGIGVREMTLLFFLSTSIPANEISISLLLHRILNIIADFLALIFYKIYFSIRGDSK